MKGTYIASYLSYVVSPPQLLPDLPNVTFSCIHMSLSNLFYCHESVLAMACNLILQRTLKDLNLINFSMCMLTWRQPYHLGTGYLADEMMDKRGDWFFSWLGDTFLLESRGFKLNRSKIDYMRCKFSKWRALDYSAITWTGKRYNEQSI